MSVHTEKLMRWKVKMASNDDMRQQFISMYVPKIWELGLTLPDNELKRNPLTGKWAFADPDWNLFFEVIKGNGPLNKERLAVRRTAEERGRWVREALLKADMKYTVPFA
jgi:ring-1,2-phenylacetyl-CoA epoxidase subunit PaaA